ncbi:MAG: GDSL-type esterase/lipase family protein, partial [Fibrobacterota bacterium]
MSVSRHGDNRLAVAKRASAAILLLAPIAFGEVAPNARINVHASVHGNPTAGLSSLVDGKFGNGSWNVSSGSWVAYKLPSSPGKVLLAWNNPSYAWSDSVTNASSCAQGSNLTYPSDYEILTSSNSTNGSDGTWISRLKISGNTVSSRSHMVETGSDDWVKLRVAAGSGGLDELGVYDASNGASDSWAFIGTSISSNAFKGSPPATDFVKLVVEGTKGANSPAVVKAGIPCILSTDVSNNIGRYLAFAGSSRFWAIEMGTNDAWGGGTGNVQSFKSALQKVVDSAKGRGIRIVIAKPLATNAAKAGWQVNQAFLAVVEDLAKTNALVVGPDLYSWFLTHPGELNDDGVHPNATGAASIQRLWAEAMLKSVYAGSSAIGDDKNRQGRSRIPNIRVRRVPTGFDIFVEGASGPMRLVTATGESRVIGRDGSGFVPMDLTPEGVGFLQEGRMSRPIFLGR